VPVAAAGRLQTQPWGASNYASRQGKKKGPTAWVRKAIAAPAGSGWCCLPRQVMLMLLEAGAATSAMSGGTRPKMAVRGRASARADTADAVDLRDDRFALSLSSLWRLSEHLDARLQACRAQNDRILPEDETPPCAAKSSA
jgi:hypothetical protein